jgi:hypothetical protein
MVTAMDEFEQASMRSEAEKAQRNVGTKNIIKKNVGTKNIFNRII